MFSFSRTTQRELFIFVFLLALSFFVSYRHVNSTGPIWPDASQYANAGAMVHDWLLSGNWLRPYSFAKDNYFQYPAFHIPYHPPVYPGMLGIFFLVTGVGYTAARVFIALCLALAAWFFYAILEKQKVGKAASFAGALLLLTIPEVAFWSGDTMSEVPSLALMLAATYFFVSWIKSMQLRHFVAALCLAEAAFLSRYISAGVLLAWLLWLFIFGDWRRVITKAVVVTSAAFVALNVGWILFVLKFSKYETPLGGAMPNANYVAMFSLKPIVYYFGGLPAMVGWPMLLIGLGSAAFLIYRRSFRRLSFWLCWLLGYTFFLVAVGIFNEHRYFLGALPVFAGLISESLDLLELKSRSAILALLILGVCLASNGYAITKFPRGVVGYEAVGQELAVQHEAGNVLVGTREQADLIFRFRSYSPTSDRIFFRADRTLVIRAPSYSDAKPIKIAQNTEDVLNIIRRGRIRYLVTSNPLSGAFDDRTEEMTTLDTLARSDPENFALIRTFPLLREYSKPGGSWQVSVWKFLGELPTQSELPVMIPSADMELQPPS
ncbi:MAG TPA: glycosyltransferase family 39 protein [Pyrinomonadaceae bacterium]|nr:glycosyltransferase family 39 protein [Pyrinomonadaceae bacterium]